MNNLKGKVTEYKNHFRNNKSSTYILLIFVIVGFYFFIAIQSYYKDPTRIYSDDIKKEAITVGNIQLNLEEQKYNPDNGLYVLKYKATSTANKTVVVNGDLLKVNVLMEKERTKINNVKIFYPLNNYFIVEIKNLPKDYKALKINFKLLDKEDENVASNSKEANQYTSAEKNNRDYNLLPKTKTEYYVDAFQLRLKELNDKFKNVENEIKKLEERHKVLEKENTLINPNDVTLSSKEKETAKNTIEENESEMNDNERKVKELRKELEEIDKTKQQIKSKLANSNDY
ncbi:TPA: hypothetical protein O4476_002123 [Staphylococcus aureus]|nr:hypothetical protein [Staphylococcus aureus]